MIIFNVLQNMLILNNGLVTQCNFCSEHDDSSFIFFFHNRSLIGVNCYGDNGYCNFYIDLIQGF